MLVKPNERWKAWSAAAILAGSALYCYFHLKTDKAEDFVPVPDRTGGIHVSADLPTWLVIVGIAIGVALGMIILAFATRGNWRK